MTLTRPSGQSTVTPSTTTHRTGLLMQRTTSYRTADDRLLLEEPTAAFRLTPRCERLPAELGVPAGRQVRVELRDVDGHLLDSLTFIVPSIDG